MCVLIKLKIKKIGVAAQDRATCGPGFSYATEHSSTARLSLRHDRKGDVTILPRANSNPRTRYPMERRLCHNKNKNNILVTDPSIWNETKLQPLLRLYLVLHSIWFQICICWKPHPPGGIIIGPKSFL